jgi:hypothetical protein
VKTEPTTLGEVAAWILRDPFDALVRRWNHKSALLSSATRALLFFAVNLPAGVRPAAAAFMVECAFRFSTAGFYGALTQAFRRVEPARTGTLAAMVVLPAAGHSLELLVHWTAGTDQLARSIGASILLTALSTSFHLFAMRRGILVTGAGSRGLLQDLRAIPGVILAFVAAGLRVGRDGEARVPLR